MSDVGSLCNYDIKNLRLTEDEIDIFLT